MSPRSPPGTRTDRRGGVGGSSGPPRSCARSSASATFQTFSRFLFATRKTFSAETSRKSHRPEKKKQPPKKNPKCRVEEIIKRRRNTEPPRPFRSHLQTKLGFETRRTRDTLAGGTKKKNAERLLECGKSGERS